jgi:hypothetical protein
VIAGSICSGVPALAAENASAASVQQAQFEEVNVTIDGVLQHFPQSAILYKGSTMVPMRGVFEALGAELYWSGRFQTVKAIKGLTVVRLSVGDSKVSINGNIIDMGVESIIVNGSTMVPLRFVAEALGAKVEWDAMTKTANITQDPSKDQTNPSGLRYISLMGEIDATETRGRLYGTENQKEYDAVLKIAKEALADLDSIPVSQGTIDYLYHGKTPPPANKRATTFYEVELRAAENAYKPLLDAGISPDTIVKAGKVAKIVSELTKTNPFDNLRVPPSASSAYDALVEGQVDCDSYANTAALLYDLAGFETGIVREGFHAYIVIKMDGQWVRGNEVLDLPSYFKEYKLSWYTPPESIDWFSYRDAP